MLVKRPCLKSLLPKARLKVPIISKLLQTNKIRNKLYTNEILNHAINKD